MGSFPAPLGSSLLSSIAADDLLIAMQQFGRCSEVVHVGSRDQHRMDQV